MDKNLRIGARHASPDFDRQSNDHPAAGMVRVFPWPGRAGILARRSFRCRFGDGRSEG
jgi:hypothetical protein